MNYDEYFAKRAEQAAERKAERDRRNAEVDEIRRLSREVDEARRAGVSPPEPPAPLPEPEPEQEQEPESVTTVEEDFSAEPDYESDGGQ